MARIQDHQKVIKLRLKGMTYSDIQKEIHIPKSTLSDWLSTYPLTQNQLGLLEKNIKKHKELSIEKIRITKRKRREERLNMVYKEEMKTWLPLRRRELEIAGIFLYWGEGNKAMQGPVSLNNTDVYVVKFYLYWLRNVLLVPMENVRVHLHLYHDMDKQKEMKYWSSQLKLPLSQFTKPYIKQSRKSDLDQKGFGHGTCGLSLSNVRLKERIMMRIKAVADYYSRRI